VKSADKNSSTMIMVRHESTE